MFSEIPLVLGLRASEPACRMLVLMWSHGALFKAPDSEAFQVQHILSFVEPERPLRDTAAGGRLHRLLAIGAATVSSWVHGDSLALLSKPEGSSLCVRISKQFHEYVYTYIYTYIYIYLVQLYIYKYRYRYRYIYM